MLWLSSPEANRLILLAAAAVLMAMSLMLTMSRSGISALGVSLSSPAGWCRAGRRTIAPRGDRRVCSSSLAATAVAWVGADAVVAAASRRPTGPSSTTGAAPGPTPSASWSAFRVDRHRPEHLSGGGALLPAPRSRQVLRRGPQRLPAGCSRKAGCSSACRWRSACCSSSARSTGAAAPISCRRRLVAARGAVTWLIAIALQESVEFSLQMPGNAVLFALLCAVCAAPPAPQHRPEAEPGARPRRGRGCASSRRTHTPVSR